MDSVIDGVRDNTQKQINKFKADLAKVFKARVEKSKTQLSNHIDHHF